MAALQSCLFVSPTPAVFATTASAKRPSTLASFPACRRERSFPGLTLRQSRMAAAHRPSVVVRAQSSGGVQPAAGRYFAEEREHVMGCYHEIVAVDNGCLYMDATSMSGHLCLSANHALKMSSNIMDSAGLNIGASNEISPKTIHGTLCPYVEIFLDAADASYNKSVRKETLMSFLGALRGLASISHILLDAALEALSHTHPRASMSQYAFNRDVEGMRNEFNQQMNDLEYGLDKAPSEEICKLVKPVISEAMEITRSFVGFMVDRRKTALGNADSEVVVS
ncbi:unnamed protein product [Urochloa decumbens]|uniref:Uncharacterized protein n=1 Tax=Urochloa decumbens TaxID=240449 RepID=A0ABC9G139_9POAL